MIGKSSRLALTGLCMTAMVVTSGCVTTQGPTMVQERQTGVATGGRNGTIEQLSCSQRTPIRLSLGQIDCKASGCQSSGATQGGGLFALMQLAGVPNFEGIGNGLQDMFTGAIQETNCFRVFDRRAMEALQQELALSGQQRTFENADYIIMGSITSINFENSNRSFGGGMMPVIGAISRNQQTATMAMDVRLVEVESGEVLHSRTYSAESGKTRFGFGGAGVGGGVGFGGAMSNLSGTAMEEVARDIVIRASYDIARQLVPGEQIMITHSPAR